LQPVNASAGCEAPLELGDGGAGGAAAVALAVDPPMPVEDALAVPAAEIVTVAVPDPFPTAIACVVPGLAVTSADGVALFGTGKRTVLYSSPVMWSLSRSAVTISDTSFRVSVPGRTT
jgi:hypothetical protein